MKLILVPTDFSECANNATNYAAELALRTKAKLLLFHAYHVPVLVSNESISMNSFDLQLEEKYRGNMKALMKELEKKYGRNLLVNYNIKAGFASDEINIIAKEKNADLIVMGTHGSSGLHEILIGSNAEKVVRHATVPVISIKDKAPNLKLETIVFATDFSKETEFIFPTVQNIAQLVDAKIKIVKIVTLLDYITTQETQKEMDWFNKRFKQEDTSISIYYAHEKQEGIRRFADVHHADMIAVGTHGRNGLSHFFNGSIAESLVNHSSLPVLTVNFNKKEVFKKQFSKIKTQGHSHFENQIPVI